MPIAIIIAIFVALFTLGAKMNQPKGTSARVEIKGGKPNSQADKKENRDNLAEMTTEQEEERSSVKAQEQTGTFENIFQLSGLYQIIKSEPITTVNNSN